MIHVIVYLIIYYYFFRGGEFRQEYGQLAHIRSIVPDNTTFVALTATATKSMKTEICKKKLDIWNVNQLQFGYHQRGLT